MRHQLIVPRNSSDEVAFAVLTWKGVPPEKLQDRLMSAIAAYVAVGHELMEDSPDYNIGDLANEHLSIEPWISILHRYDIYELNVDVYSMDGRIPWEFDDRLT